MLAKLNQWIDHCLYTDVEALVEPRARVREVILSEWYNNLIMTIIFFNCAVMATEHHGQDPALTIFQEACPTLSGLGLHISI